MAKRGLILEVLRKAVHLSALLIVVAYTLLLYYFSEQVAIIALTALLLFLLELEYIRLEHSGLRIMTHINPFFRQKEEDHVAGSIFMVISCIICFAAFNYWIAVIALFMTVFGDIFAALVGKAFGRKKILNNKTVLGTLAGFVANVIVGLLILPQLLYVVLPMAVVASFVELLTNKLDDNLTVPLFAGFTGQAIVIFAALVLGWGDILPAVDLLAQSAQ